MATKKRSCFFLVLLVAAGLIGVGPTDARAIGYDMGFFGGFNPVPSPTSFINDLALIRAGQGSTAPTLRINNHPDSAANRRQSDGFSSHYGLESRRPPAFEIDRRRSRGFNPTANRQPEPAVPAVAAAPTRSVFPLASFFDASRKLVWPSESPVADELGMKRDVSDQASLTVLEKVERYRAAPITATTDARQKLITYGQPALQVIRGSSTPSIAENFHTFLLSLYDSLGQAANPPE